MKLETFFEKFDLFADAPDAVVKLRELVLKLAFSGQLSGSAADGIGGNTGWEERTIESICALMTPGFACSKSHQVENGHVHLRTHNVSILGTLNFDLLVRIDPEKVDPQKAAIRRGDILFNNTNSQELVGKTALVDRDYEFGFSNHITRLRLKEDAFPAYVVYYLTMLRNSGYFAKLCTRWINQAAINTDALKAQSIPFPPLPEQKRIVAKVDELMALCDRLEAQQQERESRERDLARAALARFAEAPTPANLDLLFHQSFAVSPADLRKAILTLAIDGTLVRTSSKETQFGEVVNLLGGYAFKSEWFTKSSGVRLVRNQNISHGELDWRETEYLPTDRAHEFEKWALRPGDLVLSLNRPFISTGLKLAWITDADCPCLLVQRIVCLRPDPERLLAQYLYFWCNAPHFYRDAHVVPSSGVPYIAPNRVAKMTMQLPPLAEQRRIVAKVEQLMALVDQLEVQQAAARTTAEKLLEAAVAELTSES